MDLILTELGKFFADQPILKIVLIYIVYKISRIDKKVDKHRIDYQSENHVMRHFFVPKAIQEEFDKMKADKENELKKNYNDIKEFFISLFIYFKIMFHIK